MEYFDGRRFGLGRAVFARFFLGTSLLADDASSWLSRTMTTGGFVATGDVAAAPDIVLQSVMLGDCWRYFGYRMLLQAIAIIYCYSDERQKKQYIYGL